MKQNSNSILERRKVSEISVPVKNTIWGFIDDKRLMNYVSLFLIDNAPYQYLISNLEPIYESNSYDGFKANEIEFNNLYLSSSMVKTIKVSEYASNLKDEKAKVFKTRSFQYRKVQSYNLPKFQKSKLYVGINKEGRGKNSKKLMQKLNDYLIEKYDLHLSFATRSTHNLIDEFSRGFVGLRFGKSLVRDSEILAKSNFIGLVFEKRAGLLDGLKINWDFAPEVTDDYEGDDLSLSWNRLAIGLGFHSNFGNFLDGFWLVPRISIMQYSAVINQTDGDLLNFDISNSLTIGFELDYELDLSYMLARAWIGGDWV